MPRQPSIRYFKSRKAYYCQHLGQQHCLAKGPKDGPNGPTYQAAYKKFGEVIRLDDAGKAGWNNTVSTICELFLRWAKEHRSEGTYDLRKRACVAFCAEFGEYPVGYIKHHHVYTWIDKHRPGSDSPGSGSGWGPSTIRTRVTSVAAAFSWAKDAGYIDGNPLANIELDSARSRGEEMVLDAETRDAIFKTARPDLRALFRALDNTGARPSEIANATAKDWRDDIGAIVYLQKERAKKGDHLHKTAGRGKRRIILFTGDMLQEMRQRVKRYPTGLLFPTWGGKRFDQNRLNNRCKTVRKRLGLDVFSSYSFRHTFCTDWLKAGKSIEKLAELVGNSANTLRKHYSHLLSDISGLRSDLEDFRR